ncbi:MAG: hypothetical protein MH825_16570 [Cyanobacteria bacterium]|nr:hypothetical protein [Cyanobacteriota bacterium]
MFAEFRAQYPTGSLVSKLIEAANGQYIIRVTVKLGGETVATGMAAAATLEEAEDRARVRALEAFGFVMEDAAGQVYLLQPGDRDPQRAWLLTAVEATAEPGPEMGAIAAGQQLPLLSMGSAAATVTDALVTSPPTPEPLPTPPPTPAPAPIPAPEPTLEPEPITIAPLDDPLSGEAAPDEPDEDWLREGPEPIAPSPAIAPEPTPTPPPVQAMPPAPSPPAIAAPPPAPTTPFDLSDVIAKTDTLIKQLRWTRKQGSQHLQATYGKRTRAELTDEELMEFLRYLEALAATT